ncbi:hypothetical protein [Paenarthrobacter sp. C1]|uniref:hypothetical protein n=1 Tax=Paenarthrobacter sp. C1 TaxID=3400220 RepID=UPI003BF46E29
MSYTHYFPGLTATADVISDARKIIAASPVTICGPDGQDLPVLSEAKGIRLNGFEAAGEAYETFHLPGTKPPRYPDMWTFCKTEQKPYDVVVTAILIAAAVRYPELASEALGSDGDWDEWSDGVDLFERAARLLTEDEKIALELNVENMRPSRSPDHPAA